MLEGREDREERGEREERVDREEGREDSYLLALPWSGVQPRWWGAPSGGSITALLCNAL